MLHDVHDGIEFSSFGVTYIAAFVAEIFHFYLHSLMMSFFICMLCVFNLSSHQFLFPSFTLCFLCIYLIYLFGLESIGVAGVLLELIIDRIGLVLLVRREYSTSI